MQGGGSRASSEEELDGLTEQLSGFAVSLTCRSRCPRRGVPSGSPRTGAGHFRGDPEKLMERYFDAFCYLANWGTRRLMFRFPRARLDAETARKYCHTDAASVIVTDDHVIISSQRGRR
jgi:hypothetical protein